VYDKLVTGSRLNVMKRLFASNLLLISSAVGLLVHCSPSEILHPEWRGLLASRGFEGTAVKGVYFFPGEGAQRDPQKDVYTTHPLDERDLHWNSVSATRGWVMDRMVQAHVNTVVMSYWGDMPQWSPMDICSADHRKREKICQKDPEYSPCLESNTTVPEVLEAVRGRPLVIMPAIEQGNYADCPKVPQWDFSAEFPFLPSEFPDDPGFRFAPHLVARIGALVELFRGKMDLWARIYDRDGRPRYAVQVLHVSSNVIDRLVGVDTDDKQFAHGFDDVAARVSALYHIDVGFMIDTTGIGTRYSAFPREAGPALERTPSVLAIQGFASEIFSGLIKNGLPDEPCIPAEHGICEPHDNNRDNLERLADWKRDALHDWVATGVPVVLDVDNGYDGRLIFGGKKADGTLPRNGVWGDNLNYTEDRWRNWLSELKGPGIKGIVFDTWNGYTEGYAAVPSLEHGQTVYNWLTDLFEPPPWDYSHMHYVNGARTHRVYGAICEKWIANGADRGFGPPISEELPSAHGRVQYFANQSAIYWSARTNAHAVIGGIAKAYREAGADASCLGLPVSDEESTNDGKVSRFEHGTISWKPGDVVGHVTCR
jgi:LGFP repeat